MIFAPLVPFAVLDRFHRVSIGLAKDAIQGRIVHDAQ